jgi:hypothetical protein
MPNFKSFTGVAADARANLARPRSLPMRRSGLRLGRLAPGGTRLSRDRGLICNRPTNMRLLVITSSTRTVQRMPAQRSQRLP